ncbi:MAG: hypothetical protein ACRDZY_05780 [Acidimicrobiales bacterium]
MSGLVVELLIDEGGQAADLGVQPLVCGLGVEGVGHHAEGDQAGGDQHEDGGDQAQPEGHRRRTGGGSATVMARS